VFGRLLRSKVNVCARLCERLAWFLSTLTQPQANVETFHRPVGEKCIIAYKQSYKIFTTLTLKI